MTTEFSVAYAITRIFTDEELGHDPDPEDLMDILVRQVEHALRTVPRVEFGRLRSAVFVGDDGESSGLSPE